MNHVWLCTSWPCCSLPYCNLAFLRSTRVPAVTTRSLEEFFVVYWSPLKRVASTVTGVSSCLWSVCSRSLCTVELVPRVSVGHVGLPRLCGKGRLQLLGLSQLANKSSLATRLRKAVLTCLAVPLRIPSSASHHRQAGPCFDSGWTAAPTTRPPVSEICVL